MFLNNKLIRQIFFRVHFISMISGRENVMGNANRKKPVLLEYTTKPQLRKSKGKPHPKTKKVNKSKVQHEVAEKEQQGASRIKSSFNKEVSDYRLHQDQIPCLTDLQSTFKCRVFKKEEKDSHKTGLNQTQIRFNSENVAGVIDFNGKYIKRSLEKEESHNRFSLRHQMNPDYNSRDQKDPNQQKSKKQKAKSSKRKYGSLSEKKQRRKLTASLQNKKNNKNSLLYSLQTIHQIKTTSKKGEKVKVSNSEPFGDFNERKIEFEEFKLQVIIDKDQTMPINLLSKISHEKRIQCIRMLSHICGQIFLTEEVFGMAVYLFDSYLNDQVMISKHKILALGCLLLSIKAYEGQIVSLFTAALQKFTGMPLVRQVHACQGSKKMLKSSQSCGKSSAKSSKEKSKKQKKGEVKQKLENRKQIKNKLLLIVKNIWRLPHILRDQIGQKITKRQVLEFQMMILIKENFKLNYKTHAYWVDTLSMLWDSFLLFDYQDTYGRVTQLMLRRAGNAKNFSSLVQLIQAALFHPNFHLHSKSILVLGAMYLLARINMEGGKQIFDNYRQMLKRSSAALFSDRTGINDVFGQFLCQLGLDIGDILGACHFLSNYLHRQLLEGFDYGGLENIKYSNALFYHFWNPHLQEII